MEKRNCFLDFIKFYAAIFIEKNKVRYLISGKNAIK